MTAGVESDRTAFWQKRLSEGVAQRASVGGAVLSQALPLAATLVARQEREVAAFGQDPETAEALAGVLEGYMVATLAHAGNAKALIQTLERWLDDKASG